jgi:hypothetical protein
MSINTESGSVEWLFNLPEDITIPENPNQVAKSRSQFMLLLGPNEYLKLDLANNDVAKISINVEGEAEESQQHSVAEDNAAPDEPA